MTINELPSQPDDDDSRRQVTPFPVAGFSADGFLFRSAAEMPVYHRLRRIQADMAVTGETFSFSPTPVVVIPPAPGRGNWREPDFLIYFRGKVGGLEVDGSSHKGRWVADRSKDRLLTGHGILVVERIAAEETDDPVEIDTAIHGLLTRLAQLVMIGDPPTLGTGPA